MKKNKHMGKSFDSFLKEEDLLEEVEALAIKRVIAFELQKKMKKSHLTKREISTKIGTSRSALDRLLDPKNTAVTLKTLIKVSHFIGKKLQFSFA